jgi:hypothetical protein
MVPIQMIVAIQGLKNYLLMIRMAQFLKMFPKPQNNFSSRTKVMKQMMEEYEFEPSELGEKLFGFKEWK